MSKLSRGRQNIPTRVKAKTKPQNKTLFSKKQISLKIKQQERRPRKGRLGGDRAAFATPSWVPSKEKKLQKKKPSRTQCGDLLAMRLLHPVGVRNDKNREQELCGKCVRDGSGLAIRTRGIFPFFFGFWERG